MLLVVYQCCYVLVKQCGKFHGGWGTLRKMLLHNKLFSQNIYFSLLKDFYLSFNILFVFVCMSFNDKFYPYYSSPISNMIWITLMTLILKRWSRMKNPLLKWKIQVNFKLEIVLTFFFNADMFRTINNNKNPRMSESLIRMWTEGSSFYGTVASYSYPKIIFNRIYVE